MGYSGNWIDALINIPNHPLLTNLPREGMLRFENCQNQKSKVKSPEICLQILPNSLINLDHLNVGRLAISHRRGKEQVKISPSDLVFLSLKKTHLPKPPKIKDPPHLLTTNSSITHLFLFPFPFHSPISLSLEENMVYFSLSKLCVHQFAL